MKLILVQFETEEEAKKAQEHLLTLGDREGVFPQEPTETIIQFTYPLDSEDPEVDFLSPLKGPYAFDAILTPKVFWKLF